MRRQQWPGLQDDKPAHVPQRNRLAYANRCSPPQHAEGEIIPSRELPVLLWPDTDQLYQVPMTATHWGIPRRGVDLIQDWRTEEVRHASANPVEAGLRCDAAA